MAALENPQHEAFAQARFAGQSLEQSSNTAGLRTGDGGAQTSASRLARLPEIQERIAELYRDRVAEVSYNKAAAVRDLLSILHTPPSETDEHHPLCEVRMGRNGAYHRLPSKLQALSRLIKLMGWDDVVKVGPPCQDTMTERIADIREGRLGPQINLESSPEPSPSPSPAPTPTPTPTPSPDPQLPLPPKQEAYVIARLKGMGVKESYAAAGFSGTSAILAWRLNDTPEVKARIKSLRRKLQDVTRYKKEDAVRDLTVIILSSPADASPNHPLCERRKTSWGEYHRFPSKLSAILLLSRLLGWQYEDLVPPDPDAGYNSWLASIRNLS
jgi:hypothetical protein